MHNYIIASSKEWHRPGFESLAGEMYGKWRYAASKSELLNAVEEALPRYIFFLHWNWIVPSSLFAKTECVCFHMTDVPYGRGGSPLQNLIVNGRKDTMVTALKMVQEMDAGPVYCKRPMSLEGRAEDIYLRAGEICWEMVKWIVANEPEPTQQVGEVTLFKRRTPKESEVPQQLSFEQLYDFIRMLDAPTYPKAFLKYGDFKLEFSDAQFQDGEVHAYVTFKVNIENKGDAHSG